MTRTISTNYLNGLTLTNASDSPLAIDVGVTIESTTSNALQSYLTTYWSITNAGALLGLGTASRGPGLYLAAGGALTNLPGASISGYQFGVFIEGSGTVVNQGNIGATWDSPISGIQYGFHHSFGGGPAAVLLNGGGVSNGQTGVISAPWVGVDLGQRGSIENAGLISSTEPTGFGVVLVAGGSVSNASGGTIAGGAVAIRDEGAVSIYNAPTGLITAPEGVAIYQYSFAATLVNLGTIVGGDGAKLGGGSVTNGLGATISGDVYGVSLLNSGVNVANVTNSGIIEGLDQPPSITSNPRVFSGVYLPTGGQISNASGATIVGGSYGVVVSGGYVIDTVINNGLITSSRIGGGIGAYFRFGGTLTNYGTVSGAQAVVFGSATAPTNLLRVAPGAEFIGAVVGGTSASVNTLELMSGASAGTINGFGTQYQNFQHVTIDSGARWSLAGAVATGTSVAFDGGLDLTFVNPLSMNGTIGGFAFGETVSLAGITNATGVSLSATGNILTVYEGGVPGLTLNFDPTQSFAGETFSYAPIVGGTDITVSCFVKGTLIRTGPGPMPVEDLRPGMRAITWRGDSAEIVWIGHRDIDCRRHPRPAAVHPVRVAADAFGPGLPSRDLWLSPDHAVFVENVLIPIRCLVNHQTIRQMAVASLTYFHVELREHDVILAEDLPTESYLSIGDRFDFDEDGGTVRLHPNFGANLTGNTALSWEMFGAAPLVMSGPKLTAARTQLAKWTKASQLTTAVRQAQS